MSLNRVVETPEADNLINSTWPVATTKAVTFAAPAAAVTLTRGCVLALKTDGKFEKYAAGKPAAAIVAETIELAAATDGIVIVYGSGHFNKNDLDAATGVALNDSAVESLRDFGIHAQASIRKGA